MAKTGRPTLYTKKLADEIIRRISIQPVATVFEDPEMPSKQTFYNWLLEYPEFFDHSVRARAIGALRELDEAETWLEREDVNEKILHERMLHCRWKVGKLLPKQYGDKVSLEHSGSIATPTLQIVVKGEQLEETDADAK